MQELVTIDSPNNNIDRIENWERYYKMAEMLATSDIVPACYRNKPSNIFIAIQTAQNLKLDVMTIMQNTYIIQGKLGITSNFAISLANKSGYLKDSIQYKVSGNGDNMQVTAHATLKDGQPIEFTVTMAQAISEGWATKTGSKYKTLPQLMLMYRAAMFLIRTHLPQVLLCSHSVEELKDIEANEIKDVSKKTVAKSKIASLKDKVNLLVNEPIEDTFKDDVYNKELTPLQILENLIDDYQVEPKEVDKWLNKAKVKTLEELTEDQIMKSINYLTTRKQCA